MGRHEIRFRRQQMTSRRMERHKNYQDLLDQHKSRRRTRLIRLFLYLVAFLVLIIIMIYGIGQLFREVPEKGNPEPVEQVHTDLSSNSTDNGKQKRPPH